MAVIKVKQPNGSIKKFDTESKEYVDESVELTSDKLLRARKKAQKEKNTKNGTVSLEEYNKLLGMIMDIQSQLDPKNVGLTKTAFNKLKAEDKELYVFDEKTKKYVLKGEE